MQITIDCSDSVIAREFMEYLEHMGHDQFLNYWADVDGGLYGDEAQSRKASMNFKYDFKNFNIKVTYTENAKIMPWPGRRRD